MLQPDGSEKISKLCKTSHNTVKKDVGIWNSLNISYDEFITKSDSKFAILFTISMLLNVACGLLNIMITRRITPVVVTGDE